MPEVAKGTPKMVLVGEEPGPQEVRQRRPMIGPSGQLLERHLDTLGLLRQDVTLDNALLCWPPANNLDRFNAEVVALRNEQIRAENKGKPKADRAPLVLRPEVACRPHVDRLLDEAAAHGVPVMALGSLAYWSITGRKSAVDKIRGSFTRYHRVQIKGKPRLIEGAKGPIKVTASINPAYALRNAPYKEVLFRDLERAWRWQTDTLDWEDPRPQLISMYPTAAFLWNWLSAPGLYAWDIESTAEGDLLAKMRCLGIYSLERKEGIVIPWVSIDGRVGFAQGQTLLNPYLTDRVEAQRLGGLPWWEDFEQHHYEAGEGASIIEALRRWFADPKMVKIGHYSGYFDHGVMERHIGPFELHGGLTLPGGIDQILLTRIWNSEFRRSLYFTGTMLTDVPAWKAAEDERKIARDPRSYEELAHYNHCDNVVVSKTAPILLRTAQKQWDLAQLDMGVEAVCREMHWVGLYVDEPTRAEVESEVRGKIQGEWDTINRVAGAAFNPRSTKQLGKLLYDDWKLPIPLLTETGRPSTSEDALRILLTTQGLLAKGDERRVFLEALWRSRSLQGDLSNLILKLRRRSAGGIVYDDGIMRPDYGAHIPSTGRMSSSGTNTQNIKKLLRRIIRPRPGHLFVISDYDQVELRLMSAIAQVRVYLDEFRNPDSDPHAVTATLIYGDVFRRELEIKKRTGTKTPKYTALRKFAKNFVYAILYGGGASTVFETVSKATDPDTGDLLFPNMGFDQVKAAVKAWMRNAPEVPTWWEKTWAFCELHGYVEEPIMGRRRHMPVVLRNEALNLPVQGAAAIIMSQGLLRVRAEFPPDVSRGIGLVNQMHDALTLEVPEKDAFRAADRVTELLTVEYPEKLPGMVFSTEAEVFREWSEQDKVKREEV